ncbi:MAG: hypothetical protein M1379_15115 [Firmicutes bacterium]|nr:hypothetical protein [Bacillota bacterium]
MTPSSCQQGLCGQRDRLVTQPQKSGGHCDREGHTAALFDPARYVELLERTLA